MPLPCPSANMSRERSPGEAVGMGLPSPLSAQRAIASPLAGINEVQLAHPLCGAPTPMEGCWPSPSAFNEQPFPSIVVAQKLGVR